MWFIEASPGTGSLAAGPYYSPGSRSWSRGICAYSVWIMGRRYAKKVRYVEYVDKSSGGDPALQEVQEPLDCGFSTEAADLYIGYFENRHGEQWIFTFNRATREASLCGGDAGWASAQPVRDGRVDGLILAPEEAAWLQACWSATRA
jgi:hypothetical protein